MYETDAESLLQKSEPLIDKNTVDADFEEDFNGSQKKAHVKVDDEEAKRWLNPYAAANRAIFASYLTVGFGLYFLSTPLTFYMVYSFVTNS